MQKTLKIFLYIIPVLIMIWLIPFIQNDYSLTIFYGVIIVCCLFLIKAKKNDVIFLLFGLIGMIVSEYIFISTGVEVFLRTSLFGVMPLWLPLLWGYGFVVMKRCIEILDK